MDDDRITKLLPRYSMARAQNDNFTNTNFLIGKEKDLDVMFSLIRFGGSTLIKGVGLNSHYWVASQYNQFLLAALYFMESCNLVTKKSVFNKELLNVTNMAIACNSSMKPVMAFELLTESIKRSQLTYSIFLEKGIDLSDVYQIETLTGSIIDMIENKMPRGSRIGKGVMFF